MDILFLEVEDVLDLHRESIARFGGDPAIRDMKLLESAVAQPMAMFGGQLLHGDLPSMAAALLYSLVLNHPFVDGNKRTAAASVRVFLLMNGAEFDPPNEAFAEMVLAVASGQLSKDATTDFLRRYTAVD